MRLPQAPDHQHDHGHAHRDQSEGYKLPGAELAAGMAPDKRQRQGAHNSETMKMDDAMLRRFQMKVDFRMPNREERLAILGRYLGSCAGKVRPGPDLRPLVAVTEGRSPADLETIVNRAGITAVQAGEMSLTEALFEIRNFEDSNRGRQPPIAALPSGLSRSA